MHAAGVPASLNKACGASGTPGLGGRGPSCRPDSVLLPVPQGEGGPRAHPPETHCECALFLSITRITIALSDGSWGSTV